MTAAAEPTKAAFATMKKLTPVLIVDAIEPCLPFWIDRLGFKLTAEVPEGSRLGFVILAKDGVEVMYQTVESVEKDIPAAAPKLSSPATALFIEVSDVETMERALVGLELVVPRRKTFYGMDEVGAREPGGHLVVFAQPT
jgi:hypothetical protein